MFNFYYKNGLQFQFPNKEQILIDGRSSIVHPKAQTIVTHAHSDHFAFLLSNPETYTTKETIDLFYCQKKTRIQNKFKPIDYNQTIDFSHFIPDLEVKLIPAGHILGSSSVYLKYDDKKILYSSDIGGKGLLTIKDPLEFVNTEILIIESTFGSPEINFPSREELSMEILKWTTTAIKTKKNVIFSAGKIGTAQELIRIFNTLSNLRVITHGDVTPISEIYRKYGIKLEFFDSKSNEGREIIKDGEAVIIQSKGQKIVPYFLKEHGKYQSAIVTGMASRFQYKDFDAAFPYSSHANYNELIDYINNVSPDMIFTVFGLDKKLAKAIDNDLHIKAVPLKEIDLNQNIQFPINYGKGKMKQVEKSPLSIQKDKEELILKPDKSKVVTLDNFLELK